MSPLVESTVGKAKYHLRPDAVPKVKHHAKRTEKLFARLREAYTSGNRRKARQITNLIMRSKSAILTCMVRSLKANDPQTLPEIWEMTADLSAYKPCKEPVRLRVKPKASGKGFRPITSHGLRRRTLQTMAADILHAKFGDEASDYLVKNKGAEQACLRIKELIEEGFVYWVLADIENFYRSIQKKGARQALDLPNALVSNCIWLGPKVPLIIRRPKPVGESTEGSPYNNRPYNHLDETILQELSQGSRASPRTASALLGPILRGLAPPEQVVFHGDDIALGARSLEEATALKKALRASLEAHPAGSFRLKKLVIRHVSEGLDFCGYRITRKPAIYGDPIHFCPSAQSYMRYKDKVAAIVAETEPENIKSAVKAYSKNWIKSFRLWHPHWLSRKYLICTAYNVIVAELWKKKQKQVHNPGNHA